ncbi:curli production assembly/transport component CsgF [Sunxiuqinia elliptica]|uniref:Curli production assembly/transport component CsgF n=2 Tax=Sunxiuqinia elliptica TaxID=655355 RepID=A0A4V3BZ44_9BACT|nr:curli production assembly/transport component CsgF [Sunxiuqinia elliptica]TDO64688.1 curli production assembly/transport component CsgF [Sunxiuqinia elliptica]
MRILFNTLIIVFFFVAGKTYAQDFIYTPKNPAFGGNPYNFSWLMSSAQAQNDITKDTEDAYSRYSSDPLESFTESLNRQILSQLSRQIVTQQFGEDALQAGNYTLGNYQIEIGDQANGINITITDAATGSQTTVEVPYF